MFQGWLQSPEFLVTRCYSCKIGLLRVVTRCYLLLREKVFFKLGPRPLNSLLPVVTHVR